MSLWLIHTKRDRKRVGTWTRTETMEFSRNEFHWIPWIVAKSKNGMVTRSINYLASTTFPIIVIERTFFLGRYLLPLTTLNRYLHSCSDTKFIFLLLLLRMYLSPDLGYPWLSLDFVTIHWIQQKSFRENSIGSQSLSPSWTSCECFRQWLYSKWPINRNWHLNSEFTSNTKSKLEIVNLCSLGAKHNINLLQIHWSRILLRCNIMMLNKICVDDKGRKM